MFTRLAEGHAPPVPYEVNGHLYDKGYYLADGIYPGWSTLVNTIHLLANEANARFAKEQEARGKVMERAFGVLRSLWAIVRHPPRTWSHETVGGYDCLRDHP
jgi:hypothetical protein